MNEQMDDPRFSKFREIGWRRRLTPAERETLRTLISREKSDPAIWSEDAVLTRLLQDLPDPPVPSNFTALVLNAIDQPESGRAGRPYWLRRVGLPRPVRRLAAPALLLAIAVSTYFVMQSAQRRQTASSLASVAHSLETASVVVDLPTVEMLRDFEAIYLLPDDRPAPDVELLAALQ